MEALRKRLVLVPLLIIFLRVLCSVSLKKLLYCSYYLFIINTHQYIIAPYVASATWGGLRKIPGGGRGGARSGYTTVVDKDSFSLSRHNFKMDKRICVDDRG